MKKKTAAILFIFLFVLNILADTAADIHTFRIDKNPGQNEKYQTAYEVGTISDRLPDDPQMTAVQPRTLTSGLFLNTPGKRNNALFVRTIVGKVLDAFFMALYSRFGKSLLAVLLLYMTFTEIRMTAMRILHQTDGKRRMDVCLEI